MGLIIMKQIKIYLRYPIQINLQKFYFQANLYLQKGVPAIKKLYEFNRNEYSHRKQEIDREFQKRYKLVYNYYVKGLKKKFKKPVLLLDKTAIGESNIRNIESVITDNSKKLMDANRTERRLVFPKFLLNALSVLSCVYVFGYAIFEIVIYFIKK